MVDETGYFPWKGPEDPSLSKLTLLNSFTGKKEPFVPNNGNQVTWYICGPTVYDSAHVGHASNYMRFDILRRVLESYFGYEVVVQMNVTDIDDKIIKRSNERGIPFEELARYYENEFMEDLDNLNVLRPAYLTRVSEYIPEVLEYIEAIIKNGCAYESDGSVYFDTNAFTCCGHNYGKLEPSSVGSEALLQEGEGVLSSQDEALKNQKKSAGDFVLWKKSKPDEPLWDSPWGPGRPGWHIECSAMASHVLGESIDIHAGGVDLRFPHHSNEIAQAEAYHGCQQWVNYFLHAGHLHIEGLKMSKSLKNFITIRECLKRFNARQMRLAFLAHRYDAPMNYTEHGMEEAVNLDRSLTAFFGTLKAMLRDIAKLDPASAPPVRPNEVDNALAKELSQRQARVHTCLSDNVDTPGALLEIQALVKSTNAYMAAHGTHCNSLLLQSIGKYATKILRVFGLTSLAGDIAYGGGSAVNASSDPSAAASKEDVVAPILDAFSTFRDAIRQAARTDISSAAAKSILRLCDSVRDDDLPPLGVRLEDRGNDQAAVWKLEDPETLKMEIERKREAERAKREQIEKQKAARAAKLAAELEKGRLSPVDMFRSSPDYKDKFSEFDPDTGIPTKDAKGEPLTKSALKGVTKARAKQEKLHNKFLAAQTNGQGQKSKPTSEGKETINGSAMNFVKPA